jgi:RNA polymerase sigma factor (sigma-70 family)
MSPNLSGCTLYGMTEVSDVSGLLEEYARTGSREVIGELARRHAGLVYSAARRQVGDGHLAEDVTQAVFVLLFRRAPAIRNQAQLVGWLCKTTRFTALNAIKIENRRRRHEEQAASEKSRETHDMSDESRWDELSPILDEAMAELREGDRRSILLRYFEGLSVREVADAMASSEEATKKRLSRGLDRLRRLLGSKGVTVGAAVLGVTLAQRATQAVPIALGNSLHGLAAGQSGMASKFAMALAQKVARSMFLRTIWFAGAAASFLGAIAAWQLLTTQNSPTGNAHAATTTPSEAPAAVVQAAAPSNTGGAFLNLPGMVTGGAMPVDLDGSGKLEIVVPYMGFINAKDGQPVPVTPGVTTDTAAYLGAFHLDGTPLPGWPVMIMTGEMHAQATAKDFPNWWLSTPAVEGASAKTPGFVVVSRPAGPGKKNRGATVIQADGTAKKLGSGWAMPDPGTTFILADLTNNGTLDILGGGTSCTLTGSTIPGWRAARAPNGFSASAGAVAGDGKLRMFMVSQRHGAANAVVYAFDPEGNSFGAWPQKIGLKSFAPPSLGDLLGDGKMEVVLPDARQHILAWTWDGKPFGNCVPEPDGRSADGSELTGEKADQEKCNSIFKDGLDCSGPASLADLEGTGKADVIVLDDTDATLRAWRGDGTGIGGPDGIIAHLGSAEAYGVSVAGPDANGGFDFFVGGWWVHRDKDGTAQTRLMVSPTPGAAMPNVVTGAAGPVPDGPATMCQDTIADLYGDGQAEVLIGTEDGRLCIYRTGLKYSPQWAQWPMLGHDLHHTSCWTPAKN